jgi:hypothetical protein
MKLVTYYTESHTTLYQNYLIPSLNDNFEIHDMCGKQISESGNYFNEGFGETTKNKISFLFNILEKSEQDEIILFCDVDIIFLGSIENYLKKYFDHDMVFQDGFGGLNTGFFLLKNKENVRILLKKVIENCHKYHDDQITLNHFISKSNIKYTTFDKKVMSPADCIGPKIWTNEKIDIPDDTLVFHACWCAGVENKIKLLEYVRDYKRS